jgi:hypothetical protein
MMMEYMVNVADVAGFGFRKPVDLFIYHQSRPQSSLISSLHSQEDARSATSRFNVGSI